MPFFGQSRGPGLGKIRPRVLKTGDKMGLPWDLYYVLTKADARLPNSRVHPNSGAPNYNIAHNVSDLFADADLHLGEHSLSADEISSNTYNFSEDDSMEFTIADHTLTYTIDGETPLVVTADGIDVDELLIGGANITGLYLAIDGSNADQNINIGAYDLTVTDLTATAILAESIVAELTIEGGDITATNAVKSPTYNNSDGSMYITDNAGTWDTASPVAINNDLTVYKGTFGSTHSAVLGNDAGSSAGLFATGGNTVEFWGAGGAVAVTGGDITIAGGQVVLYRNVDWTGIWVGETAATGGAMKWRNALNRLEIYGTLYDYPVLINNSLFVDTDGNAGNVGIGTITPATRLEVRKDESSAESSIKTTVAANAIVIDTDYTANYYLPGLVWNTADNQDGKPKAGIWAKETGTGTLMRFGTSNNYTTGITNTALEIDQSGDVTAAGTFACADLKTAGNERLIFDTVRGTVTAGEAAAEEKVFDMGANWDDEDDIVMLRGHYQNGAGGTVKAEYGAGYVREIWFYTNRYISVQGAIEEDGIVTVFIVRKV